MSKQLVETSAANQQNSEREKTDKEFNSQLGRVAARLVERPGFITESSPMYPNSRSIRVEDNLESGSVLPRKLINEIRVDKYGLLSGSETAITSIDTDANEPSIHKYIIENKPLSKPRARIEHEHQMKFDERPAGLNDRADAVKTLAAIRARTEPHSAEHRKAA